MKVLGGLIVGDEKALQPAQFLKIKVETFVSGCSLDHLRVQVLTHPNKGLMAVADSNIRYIAFVDV